MKHGGGAIGADGEACGGDAGMLAIQNGGHVLRLHLDGFVRSGRTRIEQQPGPFRMIHRGLRPEERREESRGAFEVRGVEIQRPAEVPGGHVLACSGRFRIRQRQWQIAIAKEFAFGALLQIESIEREQQPRAELRDAILPTRFFPSARAIAGAIRDEGEVRPHAAHNELRRRGREMSITPPTESALDVGVAFLFRLLSFIPLRMHPGAAEASLELVSRIRAHQRPSRRIERETSIELLRHFLRRTKEIARHLAFLNFGGQKQ